MYVLSKDILSQLLLLQSVSFDNYVQPSNVLNIAEIVLIII